MNNTSFKTRACATLLVMCMGLAGCASTPAPTLLTLPSTSGAVASSGSASAASATMPVLALARMEIPEYIVSRRVRYRADSSTLAEWPDTYWAERIEVSLSREFVAQLRRNLPGWTICESTCAGLAPAASMRVRLDRVDYARVDKRLIASARIGVNAGASDRHGVEREFRYDFVSDLAGDSPQVQAAAYATLLGRVAADAAAAVPSFP